MRYVVDQEAVLRENHNTFPLKFKKFINDLSKPLPDIVVDVGGIKTGIEANVAKIRDVYLPMAETIIHTFSNVINTHLINDEPGLTVKRALFDTIAVISDIKLPVISDLLPRISDYIPNITIPSLTEFTSVIWNKCCGLKLNIERRIKGRIGTDYLKYIAGQKNWIYYFLQTKRFPRTAMSRIVDTVNDIPAALKLTADNVISRIKNTLDYEPGQITIPRESVNMGLVVDFAPSDRRLHHFDCKCERCEKSKRPGKLPGGNPGFYITGGCTPNDVDKMLMKMSDAQLITNTDGSKFPEDVVEPTTIKYESIFAARPRRNFEYRNILDCKQNKRPIENDGLKQKGPVVRGIITPNIPYKLHGGCEACATESAFRQLANARVVPEETCVQDIKEWFLSSEFYIDISVKSKFHDVNFSRWFAKLSAKQLKEYSQGYEEYRMAKLHRNQDEYKKHRLAPGQRPQHFDWLPVTKMKGHTKVDEKNFIDYSQPKVKARAITAQNAIAKVLQGPVVDTISKILKSDPAYGSGLSNGKRCIKFSEWNAKYTHYIGLDGSAFDSTQYLEILQAIDDAVYTVVLMDNQGAISDYADFEDVVQSCVCHTQDVETQFYKYVICGTVPSGKMSTSAMNTLRSMCYVRYIMFKIKAIEHVDYNFECCGDDVIIFSTPKTAESFAKAAYQYVYIQSAEPMEPRLFGTRGTESDKNPKVKLGQVAKKIDITDNIHSVDYLSCDFLQNERREVKMVRKITRLLQLSPWTAANPFESTWKEELLNLNLCYDDGVQMKTWCKGLPIYDTYASMLLRVGHEAKTLLDVQRLNNARFAERKYLNYADNVDNASFSLDCLLLLRERYRLEAHNVDHLEKTLSNVQSIYSVVQDEAIDIMFDSNEESVRQVVEDIFSHTRGRQIRNGVKDFNNLDYLDDLLISEKEYFKLIEEKFGEGESEMFNKQKISYI